MVLKSLALKIGSYALLAAVSLHSLKAEEATLRVAPKEVLIREDYTKGIPKDSWRVEYPPKYYSSGDCFEFNSVLIFPVSALKRQEAVEQLLNNTFLPVQEKIVADLIGSNIRRNIALYHVEKELQKLTLRESYKELNNAEKADLKGLVRVKQDLMEVEYRPYLARAIMPLSDLNRGRFHRWECLSRKVIIDHRSLGRSAPNGERWPVIVYLADRPLEIFSGFGQAE